MLSLPKHLAEGVFAVWLTRPKGWSFRALTWYSDI